MKFCRLDRRGAPRCILKGSMSAPFVPTRSNCRVNRHQEVVQKRWFDVKHSQKKEEVRRIVATAAAWMDGMRRWRNRAPLFGVTVEGLH